MAPATSAKVPSAVSELDHCHVGIVTGLSGSDRLAASSTPAWGMPMMVTAPASSALVTLIVRVSVSSISVSVLPVESLLSLTW